ncbi:MAG TPA: tetratricopeptide repeat-containing serine protease family protein [Thermodesulfovibrionales bacterium]|nr:tetratricopeptide repeat-containing serine protease family protein [Thermodesulfovibrionales bacterium]
MKRFAVIVLIVCSTSAGLLRKSCAGENVPVFTNEDLEIYGTKPMVERGTVGPQKELPQEKEVNAGMIFRENNSAVVAVAAYDRFGNFLVHGSGFFVRNDGAVVTSFHVVRNAAEVMVKAGGTVFAVKGILHTDKENDIAILKVEGANFSTVTLGDSGSAETGEKVYAMSNPEAEGNTVSEGTLAGAMELGNRKLLQITAPFFEGSSGGPVFDSNGKVIGIATFIIREGQSPNSGQVLNFVVPINLIKNDLSIEQITEFSEIYTEDRGKTAEYWISSGNTLSRSGKYEEALEAYKKAVATDPAQAAALNGLCVVLTKLKRYGEAIEACKRALEIEPDSAWVYSNIGLAYLESGIEKEAVNAFTKAIRIMPDLDAAHFNLGLAYRRLGRYKEAAEAFRNAVRINPGSAEAHFELGIMYVNLNDERAAMEEYKILRELNPPLAEQLSSMLKR